MSDFGNMNVKNHWRWLLYCALLLTGATAGTGITLLLKSSAPDRIDFSQERIPTLMMHPLGRDGAFVHRIDNWEMLTSVSSGNDSIALKYKNDYIASLTTTPDRTLESMVINHPRHDTVLLIIEELNDKDVPGKLTTDILSSDGKKIGFVIDENMDGQPDLRFEYAGPYLYVWLDESWHRVMRTSPRQTGQGFKHTVMYQERMQQIHLEQYPYQLEPLQSGQ